MSLPKVIQAGMGIAVSDWRLAQAVARQGHMGVVSGTAIDSVLVRRLQSGDPGGHMRRALAHFPDQEMSSRIFNKYFRESPREAMTPFVRAPMISATLSREAQELLIVSNFAEVYLAKEGHDGPVGINFLEKIQFPVLPSTYGAILAGVDYIIMGAGIPREMPRVLDHLFQHQDIDYRLQVDGAGPSDDFRLFFSPQKVMSPQVLQTPLRRPKFLAVISSNVLAISLSKRATNPVDGFVVEHNTAGGHNAPPRGKFQLNERGEPIYGPKDEVDFAALAELGLPFWLAGSQGSPEGLRQALSLGAAGIQVGTAFALCDESGLDPILKKKMIQQVLSGKTDVYTSPLASPTGFPFKIARLAESNSEEEPYLQRKRICDLGYLRQAYKKADGTLGYRCASEPVEDYVKKGGAREETVGRKCLCNALFANIGLGQIQKDGQAERPIITIGDDVKNVGRFIRPGQSTFSAKDVLRTLLDDTRPEVSPPP